MSEEKRMEDWMMQYQETLQWLEQDGLTRELTDDNPIPGIWYRRRMGACINAGGSENWGYFKKGRDSGLIVFFIGGGFSLNAQMAPYGGGMKQFFQPKMAFYTDECHPNNEYYFFHVLGNHGIFSQESWNCFKDWSVAMINYGTADIHIGQNDYIYTDEQGMKRVLHHHGYRNFLYYMEVIQKLFPDPERLLITGGSAGAFAVTALAAEVAERYPLCENITICPDSCELELESWPEIVKNVWKAPAHIAEVCNGDNIVTDLYRYTQKRLGKRAKYLFLSGIPDSVLSVFQNYLEQGLFEGSPEASEKMEAITRRQVGEMKTFLYPVNSYLHHFKKDGQVQHCVLDDAKFSYGDISPMDWIWQAVCGRPADVEIGEDGKRIK